MTNILQPTARELGRARALAFAMELDKKFPLGLPDTPIPTSTDTEEYDYVSVYTTVDGAAYVSRREDRKLVAADIERLLEISESFPDLRPQNTGVFSGGTYQLLRTTNTIPTGAITVYAPSQAETITRLLKQVDISGIQPSGQVTDKNGEVHYFPARVLRSSGA